MLQQQMESLLGQHHRVQGMGPTNIQTQGRFQQITLT